jgi:hypothetical protein
VYLYLDQLSQWLNRKSGASKAAGDGATGGQASQTVAAE